MWSRRDFLAQGTLAALGFAGYASAAEPVKALITPECQKAIDRGLEYLAAQQAANGSWGSGAYRENVAVTSLAALALMAGGHQPGRGKYGKRITSALEFVLAAGDGNGGKGGGLYPAGFLFNSKAPDSKGRCTVMAWARCSLLRCTAWCAMRNCARAFETPCARRSTSSWRPRPRKADGVICRRRATPTSP